MTEHLPADRAAIPKGAAEHGRLAVMGTSHVGCVKAAFSSSPHLAASWRDIFFMAVNAPMLSKQNAQGWPEGNGTVCFDIPEARAFLGRAFGSPDLRFSPADYDVVLLIDFFFCYDFSYQVCDNTPGPRRISDTPVSETLYREILRHRLGKSWYGKNGPIGEIPENSMLPMLKAMRQMAPHTQFLLAGRPAQPQTNKASMNLVMDDRVMASGMQTFEEVAQAVLADSEILFVPRSPEQTCQTSGLTPDRYSVGPHPHRSNSLDEHTNAEYGSLLLLQVDSMLANRREEQ